MASQYHSWRHQHRNKVSALCNYRAILPSFHSLKHSRCSLKKSKKMIIVFRINKNRMWLLPSAHCVIGYGIATRWVDLLAIGVFIEGWSCCSTLGSASWISDSHGAVRWCVRRSYGRRSSGGIPSWSCRWISGDCGWVCSSLNGSDCGCDSGSHWCRGAFHFGFQNSITNIWVWWVTPGNTRTSAGCIFNTADKVFCTVETIGGNNITVANSKCGPWSTGKSCGFWANPTIGDITTAAFYTRLVGHTNNPVGCANGFWFGASVVDSLVPDT